MRQIFIRQNATTCLSHRQEHSSADGVSMLQPQRFGKRFHHSSAYHPLVGRGQFRAGLKTHLFTQTTDTSENVCWRLYYFRLHYNVWNKVSQCVKYITADLDFHASLCELLGGQSVLVLWAADLTDCFEDVTSLVFRQIFCCCCRTQLLNELVSHWGVLLSTQVQSDPVLCVR